MTSDGWRFHLDSFRKKYGNIYVSSAWCPCPHVLCPCYSFLWCPVPPRSQTIQTLWGHVCNFSLFYILQFLCYSGLHSSGRCLTGGTPILEQSLNLQILYSFAWLTGVQWPTRETLMSQRSKGHCLFQGKAGVTIRQIVSRIGSFLLH